MNIQFRNLIDNAPSAPGIYKMYDGTDALLYVGKAKNISARLKQYMDITKLETHKQIMRLHVAKIEWEITESETDALILEQSLIKSEKPKYNIMMTDGKMYPMLALTNDKYPRLLKFRGKISQKKDIFGPYPSVSALNETIKTLQKVCGLRTCTDTFMKNRTRPCLLHQIKRCSAPCVLKQAHYNENVSLARKILTGFSAPIIEDLTKKMQQFSDNMDFESAAIMRDKIINLTTTSKRGVKKSGKNINWEKSVNDLEKYLSIQINKIAVFDNSHIFGKSPVGAMIVFTRNGFEKKYYRHFKLNDMARAGNDIAMMEEFIARAIAKQTDIDLIITDGGIAQWNIANATAPNISVLGVTKGAVRNGDEHFIKPDGITDYDMDKDSSLFLFLRMVRDEAHRFAISFHRAVRAKQLTASVLDEIDGIGAARKRALLNHFGSPRAIMDADLKSLQQVPTLGKSAAQKIYSHFHDN